MTLSPDNLTYVTHWQDLDCKAQNTFTNLAHDIYSYVCFVEKKKSMVLSSNNQHMLIKIGDLL